MPLTDRLPLVSCQISKFECNMKQGHRGGNSPLTILYKVQEDLIPAEFVCSPVRQLAEQLLHAIRCSHSLGILTAVGSGYENFIALQICLFSLFQVEWGIECMSPFRKNKLVQFFCYLHLDIFSIQQKSYSHTLTLGLLIEIAQHGQLFDELLLPNRLQLSYFYNWLEKDSIHSMVHNEVGKK